MTTEDSPATGARGRTRSWPRLLAILALVLAVLVGLYAWAGFKLVPRLVTSGASDYLREHHGRELVLREVRFNPFTLELRIDGMALPDADGGPMLSWRQLSVDVDGPRSLFSRAVAFDSIRLSQPRIDVVHRADGNWNLLDLLPPKPDVPAEPGPPPRLIIDLLQVAQGSGSFTDLTGQAARTEQVDDINFSLSDFSTLLSGNHFDLRASTPNIQSIRLEGTFALAPVASSGRVEINGLRLPGVQESWMPDYRPLLERGTARFDADYELALPRGPAVFKARIARLGLSDIALRAAAEGEEAVQLPSVVVSELSLDLAARSLDVAEIVLDEPRVVAVLDAGGQLNLRQYAPRDTSAAAPPAGSGASGPAAAGSSWQIGVGRVAVNRAEVDFTTHANVREPMHWRIVPLDAAAGPIAIPAQAPIPLRASATIEPAGKISLEGTHELSSGVATLAVDATDLDLAVLQPLLADRTQVQVHEGKAGAKGRLVVGGPGKLGFTGAASIGGLRVADRLNGSDLVRWRRLTANGVDLQVEPLKASIRELLFQQPYAQLVIEPNGTTNIGVALSPPGTFPPGDQPLPERDEAEPDDADVPEARVAGTAAARDAPDVATAAPSAPQAEAGTAADGGEARGEALPFDIGLVRIADGSMNFTDRTLTPQFATGILAMNGTITGLSGKPGSVAEVSIDGSVDRYAPVTIRGNVNYFAAQTLTDLQLTFDNLEMTTFSPYSGKFAGYRIEKGKLNLDTNYRIVDARLDARHHIVIDQLQLGDKVDSEDAVSLPLKLAVALLKDRNGVIDLDLPISGSLDDPKFRVGPIIWKMVKNLLVKVATSPFAFFGSLFGGGEEMQFVAFAPGTATLGGEEQKKLATLRQALLDRPGISVDIPMVQDPVRDGPALAEARWEAMLDAAAKERFGDKAAEPGFVDALAGDPKDRRRMMVTAYRTQFGSDPQWPKPDRKDPAQKDRDPDELAAEWIEQQLRPAVQVEDGDLAALGKARAEAIQDALLRDGGVDPARVFIIVADDAPPRAATETSPAPSGEAPATAGAGPVRVELSLK